MQRGNTSKNDFGSQIPASERPLLQTFDPEQGESLPGYLLRLTEANRYDSFYWLLWLAKLPSRGSADWKNIVIAGKTDLSKLAYLSGVPADKLSLMQYRRRVSDDLGDQYELQGELVPTSILRIDRPKICPECLRDAPFLRSAWDFTPVTACIRHSRLLLETCPGCGKKISWARKKVCICSCGLDWTGISAPERIEAHQLDISRYFYRILNADSPESNKPRYARKNPIFDLAPESFLLAVFFIASHFDSTIDILVRNLPKKYSSFELHQVLCRAIEVFDDWPNRYYAFLDDQRSQAKPSPRASTNSLKLEFPKFNKLYSIKGFEKIQLLREGFEQYLTLHSERKYRVKRFAGLTVGKKRFVSEKRAKILTGMGERLTHLIEDKRIYSVIRKDSSGNEYRLLDKNEILALASGAKPYIGRDEVAKKLGLPSAMHVVAFINKGFFHPVDWIKNGQKLQLKFLKEDIDAFLAAIETKILSNKGEQPDGCGSIASMFESLKQLGLNFADCAEAILSDTLPLRGKTTAPGMKGFIVSRREARAWMSRCRDKIDGVLSISAAHEYTGFEIRVLNWLAREGFLPFASRKHGCGTARGFTLADLDTFMKTYVFAAKLAGEHSTKSLIVDACLEKHGIRPVAVMTSYKAISRWFYRISDLEGLDLAAVISEELAQRYKLSTRRGNERAKRRKQAAQSESHKLQ